MLLADYSDDLFESEWLPKLYEGVAYLAKFKAYPEENKCVFILTDTQSVWGEVVKSERLARRFRSLNPGGKGRKREEHADAKDAEEAAFRAGKLSLIAGMHQLRHFLDADISVSKAEHTDLVMSISYQNHNWKWELDSLGHTQSSTLISQHLVVPLIITSGLAFNSATATPIPDQSAANLQKELDKAAKFARRSPLLGVVQALKRPRLATSLQRMSAVVHSVEEDRLPSVLLEFDEMAELLEETPLAGSQLKSSNRRRSYSPISSVEPTMTNKPAKRAPSPQSKTQYYGRDHEKDQDQTISSQGFQSSAPSQHVDEPATLYTGPPHAAKGSIQRAATGSDESEHADPGGKEANDDSVTESDSDEPTSLPPAKKRRVVVDEPSETPSGTSLASSSRGGQSITKESMRKGGSDSDSDEQPTRRAPPSRGGVGGGAMRVKQPIKRGGRRI